MKSPQAFRSIGEVARLVGVATHVLRYWETQFPALAPVRRPDGRRYYRPDDLLLAAGLCEVMREDGLTIRGAQRLIARDKGAELRERGRLRLEAAERRTAEEKDTPRRKPASSSRARRVADQAEDAASETGDTRVSGPAPMALDARPSGAARAVQGEGLRDPDAARTVRHAGERHAGDHARAPLAGPCVEVAHGLREEPGAKAAPAGLAADGVTPVQAAHGALGLPDPRAGEYGRGFPGQAAADAGQAWAALPSGSGALEGPTHGQAMDGGRSASDGPSRLPVLGQGTEAWLGRLAATAAALRARRQPLPPDAGSLHDALRRMQDDG